MEWVPVSGPSVPADEPMPAELGEVLGGYRLEEVIGRGGMGCVYSASHARLNRKAAVKVLKRAYAGDTEYVARFFDEAQVVNAIRHPNIIDIFDFVELEAPHRVACIMELLEGPTLRQVLKERPLGLAPTLNLMIQLTDALDAVHQISVVHRDLKPDNLVIIGDLDSDLSVVPSMKVLDFGIAKVQLATAERTTPGLVLGTPAYMSPEQVGGQTVSGASDVYSLGALFFETLMGRRLFVGDPMQVFRQKLLGEIPEIELPSSMPERSRVRSAIRACLHYKADDRIRLADLQAELVSILATLGPSAPTRKASPRARQISGARHPAITETGRRALPTPMPSASLVNDTVATYPGQIVKAEGLGRGALIAIGLVAFVLAAVTTAWVRIGDREVVLEALPAPVSKPTQPAPTPIEAKKPEVAPTPPNAAPPPIVERPARTAERRPVKKGEPAVKPAVKPDRPAREPKGPLKKDDMVPW